ncbi:MAG: MSMEG_1061 family FMN-dependent PPOX-type flavoprotein [Hyphomicrobiaceae bacterium]
MNLDNVSFIETEAELRAKHHAPLSRATDKVLSQLDTHCMAIIGASPFCLLATQGRSGADVTPRGDPAGFVRVLDPSHILVPDRIGNNRLDTMTNILDNPSVGLIFLVPGMNETLRINGRARITDDDRLLASSSVNGRPPKVGILVAIVEAFMHCPKAFVRSKLWDAATQIDRATLPSYTEILMAHCAGLTEEENARQSEIMSERGLY